MDVQAVIHSANEAMTVRRVFGEPYSQGDVTVIPVAKIRGGAGGGEGTGRDQKESGAGTGFGLMAGPAGAYELRGGRLRWRPAVDINRVIMGGQLVAMVGLLTLGRWLLRRR